MGFVHLHLHTEYSLLDGACRIGPLLDAVKAAGMNAAAITDHGAMYGVIEFYKAARERGIRPIIGCETYVAARSRLDKTAAADREHAHLILLCENNEGYQNLIALCSAGFTEGFYGKPRIDHELLESHHTGLIALSACLAGEIPRALSRGDYAAAKETALWYDGVFGRGNFYLELQDHGILEQKRILPDLARLSTETGIPLVATNDVHYIQKQDARTQSILLCIGTNHTVEDADRMEFETDEFYLKTPEEMAALFPNFPEAISNTERIAARCDVTFEFGKIKLPHFDIPGDNSPAGHFHYLRDLCYEGLHRYYGETPEESVVQRLEYELDVIHSMGYVDYYLIVYDYVRFARETGIPVGPGRGSGAGSLAAYCVGITGIDPIRYNLIFERFLNPERISMPDFDVDFCYIRRQEVIDYVIRKYGADHVTQIIAFDTMAARGAIRDVGRALAIPYNVCDAVAKKVPSALGMTLDRALQLSPDLKADYDGNPQIRDLLDTARQVEGMPRHASTHAAGVVITRDPAATYVPLAKKDETVITQFEMTTLEELGLLKMDFLGLRNLTVISDASRMIRRHEPDFQIENISLDDQGVFQMLTAGTTEGVFQFESAGMRGVLMGLGPESLEDLIAVISLYRPGPMESIPTYIRNRHNPELVTYKTPLLEPILSVTYGCLVYQEQVMEVVRTLAGYSYGRADLVRRAMAKKKHAVMEKEREAFVHGSVRPDGTVECEGAVKRGVPEDVANAIFDEMTAFASYAFNKSHAAAYALIAYETAWLKFHWPREYMAALLTSVLDFSGKVASYIAECRRMAIPVLPPHINESEWDFTVTDNGIRFGLLAVKNLGRGFIDALIAERQENGPYTSFYDFCARLYNRDLNRRALESLIKCGALDGLGLTRLAMIRGIDFVLNALTDSRRRNLVGQIGFFDGADETDAVVIPNAPELSPAELLKCEKEVTGLYLSGHPMADYEELSRKVGAARLSDLSEAGDDGSAYKDNDRVTVIALVTGVKQKATKNNALMAFVTLEDLYGTIEMLVFPKIFQENADLLREGTPVRVTARLSLREDKDPELLCDTVSPPEGNPTAAENRPEPGKRSSSSRPGLYLRAASLEDEAYRRAERVMRIFYAYDDMNPAANADAAPVYLVCRDTGKRFAAPRGKWVQVNLPMLGELSRILGEENVKYISG